MMKICKNMVLALLLLLLATGCEKEFLEAKPKKSLLVPSNLEDMRSLMDNIGLMNLRPSLGDIAAGEFVLTDNSLPRLLSAPERGTYLFDSDPYQGAPVGDWDKPYEQIFATNVVIEGLQQIEGAGKDELMGTALFFRGRALFGLAQTFCRTYRAIAAGSDPGIPLPLSADVNRRYPRGTLEQTYARVLEDLTAASKLLGDGQRPKSRPNRHAALAMLARVNLEMGRFEIAAELAGQALSISSELNDFNAVKTGSFNVFPQILPNNNAEVIFYTAKIGYGFFGNALRRVDPNLLALYASDDLRKSVLFYHTSAGAAYFSGYEGLTNSEVMLIAAECAIRGDRVPEGMEIMNRLWAKRCRTAAYHPLVAGTRQQAMALLVAERRRELVLRGMRWSDIKRFNAEGEFVQQVARNYNGQVYALEPGDRRFVFPIPDDELLEHGIEQN